MHAAAWLSTAVPTTLGLALDVADKVIKLAAVGLGGVWNFWNYRTSRTYEQKMDLQLTCSIFRSGRVYFDICARLKNLGATRHTVQQEGSSLEVAVVRGDLTEQLINVVPVSRVTTLLNRASRSASCCLSVSLRVPRIQSG
jgi:hypothetical protein